MSKAQQSLLSWAARRDGPRVEALAQPAKKQKRYNAYMKEKLGWPMLKTAPDLPRIPWVCVLDERHATPSFSQPLDIAYMNDEPSSLSVEDTSGDSGGPSTPDVHKADEFNDPDLDEEADLEMLDEDPPMAAPETPTNEPAALSRF